MSLSELLLQQRTCFSIYYQMRRGSFIRELQVFGHERYASPRLVPRVQVISVVRP
jgi:hypothetical protein